MFPLGAVLLPSMLMPLRIFEPRYRALADVVVSGDRSFGVVLIERGSEVGGGDVRTDVGCLARVLDAEQHADGQWSFLCVGEERLRVARWLPDDPYPRADVDRWSDEVPGRDAAARAIELERRFRAVLALAVEATGSGPTEPVELSPDPVEAVWQMSTVTPLGSLDRHRLLSAPSLAERVPLLEEMLDDAELLLRARLGR
jgi:Lon protease-like protein